MVRRRGHHNGDVAARIGISTGTPAAVNTRHYTTKLLPELPPTQRVQQEVDGVVRVHQIRHDRAPQPPDGAAVGLLRGHPALLQDQRDGDRSSEDDEGERDRQQHGRDLLLAARVATSGCRLRAAAVGEVLLLGSALAHGVDDERVEDSEHREREERVDARVQPRPYVNMEVAVGHVDSGQPAEETHLASGDGVHQHRAREQVVRVEREDRHGNAGDDVDGLATREVHVRPEREADGDVALGCHGDEKRDGEVDGVVEEEEDDLARPHARRVDETAQPPNEGDHQRHCVTSANGAHVQARAVLAHALAERHD